MADELETIVCEDAAAWDGWLATNHGRQEGVWLKIAKQPPGLAEVAAAKADGRWDRASHGQSSG